MSNFDHRIKMEEIPQSLSIQIISLSASVELGTASDFIEEIQPIIFQYF